MRDRDFLIWLHERLTEVHGESPLVDYMHKLRAIIASYPNDKVTPNADLSNDLGQLIRRLGAV